MPRLLLFICFSFSTLFLLSQNSVVLELGDFANRQCVADPSTTVRHPEFWIAYATLDDQIGSAIDPAICVDWTQNQISVSGITGASRPIFIEYIGVPKYLEVNSTYSLEQFQGEPRYDTNVVIAQYAIDLEYESEGVTRQLLVDQIETNYNSIYASSSCVITEHMDDPLIVSYIVEVNSEILMQEYTSTGFVDFPSIGFYQFSSVLKDVLEVENGWSTKSYRPAPNRNFEATLLGHRLPGVPSPTNIDTFYVRADFNPIGPDTATLVIDYWNDLLIQPFIEIAFNNTADPTFTPPFELEYYTDFCLPFQLVERPVAPGDGIVFNGGQPIFGNRTACIQLNEASYLEVAKDERLWYGQNGMGMLAIKEEASIVLQSNSQMLFDGTIALAMGDSKNAKIKILDGAHLEFSEACEIIHLQDLPSNGQIKVELEGGSIDLSALSDQERSYFQISAEENVPTKGEDFLSVWHQPSENKLMLTPKRNITGLTVNVYSIAGQLLSVHREDFVQENSTRVIDLPNDSPVSVKAVQLITDKGEQQTLTLMF